MYVSSKPLSPLAVEVRAHAIANYEDGVSDLIVETLSNAELEALIGDAKSEAEAIARVRDHFKYEAAYREDIRNS